MGTDGIEYLMAEIKRLRSENGQIREELSKATKRNKVLEEMLFRQEQEVVQVKKGILCTTKRRDGYEIFN